MSCAGRLLLGCSLRGREPLDILWWAAMAQETRFSTQPLARGTQQRSRGLLLLFPFALKELQSMPVALPFCLGRLFQEKPLASTDISNWFSATSSSGQFSSFMSRFTACQMCELIFSHEQLSIVVQWDSQASIYTGDTMNVINMWSKLLLISNMNDFIWLCVKSVQLMTFQVSSFYPEIIKNLLITFFKEKSKATQIGQNTTNLSFL